VRVVRGVTASFYKRYGDFLYMDFKVNSLRVKESTKCTRLEDAVRVAERRIQRMQEECNGMAEMKELSARARAAMATVREVLDALEGGDKMFSDGSLRTYKAALLRLARVVDAEEPWAVRMDAVLSRANLERFYSLGQGREGKGVNWVNRLPCNVGLNTTLRNVRALFRGDMLELKFKGLKLPPMDELKKMPKLAVSVSGFKPWPPGVWEQMLAEAEELRTTDAELWLVNAMQRFLGLRNRELWHARREWITTAPDGRAWLNIEDHRDEDAEETEVAGFEVLKHGRGRKLELNEELKAVLLQRTGWLVAPHLAGEDEGREFREDARHAFIYRTHAAWLRKFIPHRVKAGHELRMYAGSLVAKAQGIEAASYFLGHTSIVTTQNYYWAFMKASPMLDAAAMAGAHG
jgi:integrase